MEMIFVLDALGETDPSPSLSVVTAISSVSKVVVGEFWVLTAGARTRAAESQIQCFSISRNR